MALPRFNHISNRSGVKHGVRWDGWVAVPKRVTSPRGLGGLVQFDLAILMTRDTPHLKNGGRGRAQWPGRKLPPANINPPYVWLDGEKHVTNMHFYGYTTRINAKTAIWGGAPREIRGRIELFWGRI